MSRPARPATVDCNEDDEVDACMTESEMKGSLKAPVTRPKQKGNRQAAVDPKVQAFNSANALGALTPEPASRHFFFFFFPGGSEGGGSTDFHAFDFLGPRTW